MNRWVGHHSIALLGLTYCLCGCSMQYNGAFGPSEDPTDAYIREQIRTQQRQTASTDNHEGGQDQNAGQDNVVQFTQVNQPRRMNLRNSAKRRAAAITEVPTRSTRPITTQTTPNASSITSTAGRTRPISLYGQLPNTQSSAAISMESPDNVRRITFANEGADFDPNVDPAGRTLVFASTQHRETSDLYLKRISGNTITQLTNDPADDIMPTFSNDGKRIAFASNRAGTWDIYMIDAGGGQPVQMTNGLSDDLHPSFSPDGKQLVYCSFSNQSEQWELVVIDVENPSAKRFIGFGLFPEWSPNDNRIVFQRARERGTRWFGIWKIDLVNGEGVRPTLIAASTNAACITPTWSPDGQSIAFCTVVNPDNADQANPSQADIWIVSDDGGARANLTNNDDSNLQPTWASDGAIYYVSNRAGETQENIWSVRPGRALQIVGSDQSINQQSTQVETP